MGDPVTGVSEAVAKSAELANTLIKEVAIPVIKGVSEFVIGKGGSGDVKMAEATIKNRTDAEKWVADQLALTPEKAKSDLKLDIEWGLTPSEQDLCFVKVYAVTTKGKEAVLKRVGAQAMSKKDVRIMVPFHLSWKTVDFAAKVGDGEEIFNISFIHHIQISPGGSVGRYYNWQSEDFHFNIKTLEPRETGGGPVALLAWHCDAPGGAWIACPSFDKNGTLVIKPGDEKVTAEGESSRSLMGL